MKFPRVEVGYNIVFNNTGFDWTDIQDLDREELWNHQKRRSTEICAICVKVYMTMPLLRSLVHIFILMQRKRFGLSGTMKRVDFSELINQRLHTGFAIMLLDEDGIDG